ncbi:MAG: hypothetical protein QOD10_5812 [Mycobacterium sp.]|nr:hypothetical protein [Mycobacterium sp.]
MAAVVTVNDVLDGHVDLDVECLDRIYLNGYVPNLQVGGQVVSFMTAHLGNPIPSPAIMEKIGTAFRTAVQRFAADNKIPVVRFGKDDRKIEVMRPYLARQARTGRSGVAAIGTAQEFQNVFASAQRTGDNGVPWFSFTKADRRVTCFYFYLWDADFGPAFIKICTYFPYPIKVWLNGHEWAKRQATQAGIGFSELSNGFATCADPAALQAICDRLGPGTIGVFFERWMSRLPLPLTEHDRAAGYWWELSMRQIEVSRTLVFDAPRHARGFFEALVADNLDLGRPDSVELIFAGPPRGGRPRKLDCVPKTKIVTRDTGVTVNAFYKHSRIKQYLKDGRALRIETVVNSPDDLRCHRRLEHLDELQTKARDVNRRLLDTERVGQGCVLASPAFERVALPTRAADGSRISALRFGDPRVMALLGALCVTLNTVVGFTHRSLRAQVTGRLGSPYTRNQMSYDLARLRRNQIIERLPHTNTYVLTADGQRVAIFYTKVHDRLLRPLLAADQPPAPPTLRNALRTIDTHVTHYIDTARLPLKAA